MSLWDADFEQQLQAMADGKIACACGNKDWQQFLYVSADGSYASMLAGCKRCGQTYTYDTAERNRTQQVRHET